MEEGRVNENLYQCIYCGEIHRSNINEVEDLGDGIYYGTYCPRCRDVAKHLWVGEDESEVVIYYDVTLDERYY